MNVTKDSLIDLGFKEIPHFTITQNLVFDLGRNRSLAVGSVGTPNEVMFICQEEPPKTIESLVCVHNYDYDGYLTMQRVKDIIAGITGAIQVKKEKHKISASVNKKSKGKGINRHNLLPGVLLERKDGTGKNRTLWCISGGLYYFVDNTMGFHFSWIKEHFYIVQTNDQK